MQPRSLLSLAAPSFLLLLGEASALFGFGRQQHADAAEASSARARAIALIRENAGADDFDPPAAGVGRQDAARFIAARAAGKLLCGDSSSQISWEMVNDDFCDCLDGSDEPGTSACNNGVFTCTNRGHRSVRLPSSRVGDGVCDCCDGTDEPEGVCRVSCEEASEAWIADLADRVVKAEKGAARRAEYAQEGSKAAAERTAAIEEMRLEVEETRERLAEAKKVLETLEEQESHQRDTKLAEAQNSILERIGNTLDPERLTALAVAVASAEEPLARLESVCRSVSDGVDVGVVLADLLNDGKDQKKDQAKGNKEIEEEEEFLNYDDDYEVDYDGAMGMDHDDDMHFDDYYGDYGEYGYGGIDDDFLLGDEAPAAPAAPQGKAAELSGDGGGTPVPELDAEITTGGKGRRTANSQVAMEGSDEEREQDDDDGMMEEEDNRWLEEGEERKRTETFKPPHQFKTIKFETPKAVDGRKRVKDLGDEVKLHDKKIKTLVEEASTDFGPDGALWPLKDKCITAKTRGYEYRVCPFKDAHQEAGKSKTLIGKWKGVERTGVDAEGQPDADGGDMLLSGDVLVFDRGQKCWNGPARSLRVSLACGPEDVLSAVAEPDTCAYTAVLETPAACSPDLKGALVASSRLVGGGGGGGDGAGSTSADMGGKDEL